MKKQLTLEDIVVGKKYVVSVEDHHTFKIGDVITAIDNEGGAYHNDGNSHGFVDESGNWQYVNYDSIKEQEIDMTPCKELGYEVGQVFEVVQRDTLNAKVKIGDLAILTDIGGWFEMLNGKLKGVVQRNRNFAAFKRIYPPTPKSKPAPLSVDVTVVCEGKKTTISRSSAEKLNLI